MDNFIVELALSDVVFQIVPPIDCYAGISSRLDAENLLLIRLKLEDHGDMVEVGAAVGACDYGREHVAPEQQDVTRLCLRLELVLGDVVEAPRLVDARSSQLVLVAHTCLLVLDNDSHPLVLRLFAVGLELELSRLPF